LLVTACRTCADAEAFRRRPPGRLRPALSRLILTYNQVEAIITQHGFTLKRHGATSHRRYEAVIGGKKRFVDLAPHRWSDEVKPKTLASIMRQSGLPKSAFRI
jgi:predicted RNA binding protein YcfA (HicA-like mRNA interferase family)